MNQELIPLLVVAMLGAVEGRGQGCSDAGVCTAGPIGELPVADSAATEPLHFARLAFSYAVGEQNTLVTQVVPELGIGITRRLGVQVKLPYLATSGNLGTTSGVGDPTITASYVVAEKGAKKLTAVLGVKLPANDADLRTEDRSLPMPYQTSLGTTDLLLGATYRHARWNVAVAYQHVLDQGNMNEFRPTAWTGPDSLDAQGYFTAYHLQRANDAVARVQYALTWGKLRVQPGLLGIVHLGTDQSLQSMEPRTEVAIANSDGLTLNLTVDARYALGERWALELAYGSPLVTREVRPDGLTRSVVLNLGVAWRFGPER